MDLQSSRLAHADTIQEDSYTLAAHSRLAGKSNGAWDDLCIIRTSLFPMESAIQGVIKTSNATVVEMRLCHFGFKFNAKEPKPSGAYSTASNNSQGIYKTMAVQLQSTYSRAFS